MPAKRNLDNVIDGPPSKMTTLRMDTRTKDILELLKKIGMNKSEFIRNAILEKAVREKLWR